MTADDVRALLQRAVDDAGSVKAWAEANRVSSTFVSDVLKGWKQPSTAVLDPLGLRRVVTYEKEGLADAASLDPTSAGSGPTAGTPPAVGHGRP